MVFIATHILRLKGVDWVFSLSELIADFVIVGNVRLCNRKRTSALCSTKPLGIHLMRKDFERFPAPCAYNRDPRNPRRIHTASPAAKPGSWGNGRNSLVFGATLLAVQSNHDSILPQQAGSGTTLQVSKHLGRRAVGIELNHDYLSMIERRLQQSVLALEIPA
ncbi:MAG: DNA methyltransferase [Thermomicrobiales bacterium]